MTQKEECGVAAWSSVLLLLLLLQLTAARTVCPQKCIPLSECVEFHQLLRNPTRENIAILQDATCSYEKDPTVCCPQKQSLLPKKCGQGPILDRVVGGTEAPLGSHPWMAVLGYSEPGSQGIHFLCGGSVISERYILTAAHCLHHSALQARKLEVIRLGEWDIKTDPDCYMTRLGDEYCSLPAQNFTAEAVVTHPDYDTRVKFSDDIGLIRLNRPIDLSGGNVRAICLPPQGLNIQRISVRQGAWAAGWGITEKGTASNRMLHVGLPIVDKELCNATYKGELSDEQLCAGGRSGQDSCSGDSGGPLIMSGPIGPPYLQIGVVSYGPVLCGQMNVPGIYTSVSQYRNWVENNMRP